MLGMYRKSSLEKLESPDHLDKMVSIISPNSKIVLLAGIIVIISLIFWSFFGQLSECMQVSGIYVEDSTGINNIKKGHVICYTLLKNSKYIKEGMSVSVVPLNVSEKEYGHLLGSIVKVSSNNITYNDMSKKLKSKELVQYFNNSFSDNPIVEVEIQLEKANTTSSYKWSNSKGDKLSINNNMLVDVNIILNEDKPINKLLSSF